MDKKYLPNLDFLRVIAAYFVMLFHLNWEGSDPLSQIFAKGYLGVSVFFCISGFITPLAMQWSGYKISSWKSFLISRFLRLYPAFAVVALFEILLHLVCNYTGLGYKFDQITLSQLVTNFTWTAEFYDQKWLVTVFWTLAIEAQFTIAILFIYPLMNHKYEFVRVIPIVVLIIANYFVGKGDSIVSYMAIFGMGMVVYLYRIKRIHLLTLISVLTLAYVSYSKQISEDQALVSLCTATIMLLKSQLQYKFIPYFGKFAYSFFLIHITFGGATCFQLRFFPEEWYYQLLKVLIASIVSFYASWIFYHKVEFPFHLYSRKLKNRNA